MNIVIVHPPTGDYNAGVNSFLTSLGWTYLTHRYAMATQELLLRLFTLSGLDPWDWERFTMQQMTTGSGNSRLLSLLSNTSGKVQSIDLQASVAEIWNLAVEMEAPVGEPPHSPDFLAGYGYTQTQYLLDLAQVYGAPIDIRYHTPWPTRPFAMQRPLVRPALLRQAVAMMGATAGAIELLIKLGGSHGEPGE